MHNTLLNAVTRSDWATAVRCALRAYYDIEPVHYPLEWHPVRVVRKWVLLKLLGSLILDVHEGHPSVQGLREASVEWAIIGAELWTEIMKGVKLSHGEDCSLAQKVRLLGHESNFPEIMADRERKWGMYSQREWAKVRAWTYAE